MFYILRGGGVKLNLNVIIKHQKSGAPIFFFPIVGFCPTGILAPFKTFPQCKKAPELLVILNRKSVQSTNVKHIDEVSYYHNEEIAFSLIMCVSPTQTIN